MFENLYIHIPFCRKKCDYCAFFSVTDTSCREKFLEELAEDIRRTADVYGRNFDTLYIGGGTPTLLSEKELEFLFGVLDRNFDLQSFNEISIESNPETLTKDKLDIIGAYVNRLSMGVQSFNSKLREILGRDCSDRAIYNAIELINNSAIKNFNLDLIYAIPGETTEDFAHDLEEVRKAGATHMSCYNLTLEEQTELADKKIKIDEDIAIELYAMAVNNPHYKQYEISNYAAAPEFQCRHNRNIWRGGTLLGLGPSASSFDGEKRFSYASSLDKFLKFREIEDDVISFEERRNEIFAVNLRCCDGWEKSEFEVKYPGGFDFYIARVRELSQSYPDFFNVSENRISLTPKGLLFWDEIVMELL